MSIKENYTIKEIPYKEAMEIVIENHYLHRKCPCSKAYGLIEEKTNRIVGVVTYGVSCSSTLLKGICGEGEKQNVYELNRLWISDDVPKNGESFLIANTLKMLDKEIIVSFADSSQNHVGYVYQATNFIYCGLSAKFKDPKVKGLENQHHATYAHGLTMKQVKEKYGEENVYYVDRPRKHRYVIFNCNKKRKKELLNKLRYKIEPYPKVKADC
jgi:hypothetical protein